ncbi:hypothetical protein [Nocardia tengchongensis]|uniref:hypothetical protein n=1 Tax=Nocardia tengchongensis TaxID=2055889 RepID=UPI003660063F
MTTTPTNTTETHLVLPTPVEGRWEPGEKSSEKITLGPFAATLTPEGKGAKRAYTITRKGKLTEKGTFARLPRKMVNKRLAELHFAALSTTMLQQWRTALKAVLRGRDENRWEAEHGVVWERWQAVCGSLDKRAPAGKILEPFEVEDNGFGTRRLKITIRSGPAINDQSDRVWAVTGWAPLHNDTNYPGQLAALTVTSVGVVTTSSDGTDQYAYKFDANDEWGGIFARLIVRVAAELTLYQAAAEA